MSEYERDILITRVADGEASPQEWERFRALAERDPSIWRELAELQRVQNELVSAVSRAVAVAEHVEAPATEQLGARLSERFRLIATWSGWLAAACIGLAWAGALPRQAVNPPGNEASVIPSFSSPDDYLNQYLARGRQAGTVIDQAPAQMMDARQLPDGQGIEVVFIRQIVERRVTPDLYRFQMNEGGEPVPLRIEVRPGGRASPRQPN